MKIVIAPDSFKESLTALKWLMRLKLVLNVFSQTLNM